METLTNFVQEWRGESNPWKACYREGLTTFEIRFLVYSVGFIILNVIGYVCQHRHRSAVMANSTSPPDHRSLRALLATRPTVIAATVHSFVTSVIALGLLLIYNRQEMDFVKIWQTVGLPISLSYFVIDTVFYCLVKKDLVIFFHHVVMCICHYPVTHDSGAIIAGLGDIQWITWLSIVGYTSEVSTAVMNYRWYLLNTLEVDWIGFGIVNGFVAVSWLVRVVLFIYLLITEIVPRAPMFLAKKQMLTFTVIAFGHVAICLLSLYWFAVMCRGGIKSLFVFKKKSNAYLDTQRKSSFAESLLLNHTEQPLNNDTSKATKHLNIIQEADAYIDGTLFNGKQTRLGQKNKVL